MINLKKTFILSAFAALLIGCSNSDKPVDLDKLPLTEQIAFLDAKIRKEPKNSELYYKRAEVFLKSEDTHEALSNIQKAVALSPKRAEYYVLQADILFAQGETALAFNSLQKAIETNGKCLDAYLKSAELSLYMKDYDKLMFNIKQAMLLNKNEAKAY